MISIEEQLALGRMNPELQKLVDSKFPMMSGWRKGTSVNAGRQFLRFFREQQRSVKVSHGKSPWIQVDSEIVVPDWGSDVADGVPTSTVALQVRVHKPRRIPKGGCPAMVCFAGGGYLLHDFDMSASLCHRWTALGGIAIDVGYRLAPENPFPIPVKDCCEAVKWVARNIRDLGLNPQKGFIVAGESSGAAFALVAAHVYHQEAGNLPPLTGIYASIPWGVSKETVPERYKDRFLSRDQPECQKAPSNLDLECYEFSEEHYKPDPTSPLAYPIAFPDHSFLPRTYFQVCGLDPVRDCGLILEQVFRDAGVETKMDVYPGMTHGFWLAFPREPFSHKPVADSTEGLKWLLRKGERAD